MIGMERRLRATTAIAMAMLVALPAGKSWAQEIAPAAAPAPTTDSEIVVTAQRRAQRLQDVPISASVTTGAEIQRTNVTNLEDLTSRLPNVSISKAPASDFINIRGVGSSLNLGFEQLVGTFVDGLYRGRALATRAALFDVQQVEIPGGGRRRPSSATIPSRARSTSPPASQGMNSRRTHPPSMRRKRTNTASRRASPLRSPAI